MDLNYGSLAPFDPHKPFLSHRFMSRIDIQAMLDGCKTNPGYLARSKGEYILVLFKEPNENSHNLLGYVSSYPYYPRRIIVP